MSVVGDWPSNRRDLDRGATETRSPSMTSPLFTSVHDGGRLAPHRVVMAPMTRARSTQPGDVPNTMNARYYAQRASAALIVTEATQVSPQGKGYSFTPGIYSAVQVAGWRPELAAGLARWQQAFRRRRGRLYRLSQLERCPSDRRAL